VLGPGVQIGQNCVVGSNTVVGEVGFGLVRDELGVNLRIPHLGSVFIGNDVEIGALCSIAAGTIEPTRVADRARIDDPGFIAHNCDIGEDVIIIAGAEISGSVQIGNGSWIGPNAAIRDGLTIAPGSLIGIGSTVVKSIDEAGVYAGSPARLLRKNAPDGVKDGD
jgi:UDP-3-O-[3-hydroxymyristoyl] glucosamine N-acyltransferase